jgi:hypothetical protein
MHADRVVVIVFDGLRPDMVTPDRMPELARFAAGSQWFRQARSVFPSMTRVATSSVATGVSPSQHGIVGNAFYFPEVTTEFVLDVSKAEDIALAEARLNGRFLTAPTFADALAAGGRSFAVVHSGSPGSTYAINPNVKANRHWTFSVLGARHTRTPEAVLEMVERFGPLPPRNLPRFEEIDYAERVFSEHVLPVLKPDVALIWFNEPDTSYHYRFLGSPETHAVMAHVDAAFGRILSAISARPDAVNIAIIVASDHGQISSNREVPLAQLLSDEGHPCALAADRNLAGAAIAMTGGNMGEIRILDGDLDRRNAIADWLMQQDFIGMVFTPSEDPSLGSVPGTLSTSLVRLDHVRQPELVYIMQSGTGPDAYGLSGLGAITGSVPVGGGMHGGLNQYEVNTVLMLGRGVAGAGDIYHAPCGLLDIAPTILDLLGLAPVAPMEGDSLLKLSTEPLLTEQCVRTSKNGFRQSLRYVDRGAARFFLHGGRET